MWWWQAMVAKASLMAVVVAGGGCGLRKHVMKYPTTYYRTKFNKPH